jgi:hypothetical protein
MDINAMAFSDTLCGILKKKAHTQIAHLVLADTKARP